ncbi:MAG: hypothetical protein RL019_1210 [Pseudomonadota bacterium]
MPMWGPRRGRVALVWPNGDTGFEWFACARGARNQGALRWASGLGVETMLAWVKNQRVRGVDVVLPTQQQHASVPMWQDAMQAHATLEESLQLQTGHDVVLDFCQPPEPPSDGDDRPVTVWWADAWLAEQVQQALQQVGAVCRSVQGPEFALARGLTRLTALDAAWQPVRWRQANHTQWLWVTHEGLQASLQASDLDAPTAAPQLPESNGPAVAWAKRAVAKTVWVLDEWDEPSAGERPATPGHSPPSEVALASRCLAEHAPPSLCGKDLAAWCQALGATWAEVPT